MAKLFVPLALLMGSLAAAPSSASLPPEVYTASTRGDLSIDAEGRVTEVTLDHQRLGAEVMQSFEAQIRTWRFEPILNEGKPAKAHARVFLGLFVVRQPGEEGVRIGFKEVTFFDATEEGEAAAASRRMKPPRYPREQLSMGVGARVRLYLQLDEKGRVVRSAVDEVFLLGNAVEDRAVHRHVEVFRRASEKVAAEWVVPDARGGRVLVPVNYTPDGAEGRWVRTRFVPVQLPAWVAEDRVKFEAEELGSGGIPTSERWKLLTSLDG